MDAGNGARMTVATEGNSQVTKKSHRHPRDRRRTRKEAPTFEELTGGKTLDELDPAVFQIVTRTMNVRNTRRFLVKKGTSLEVDITDRLNRPRPLPMDARW